MNIITSVLFLGSLWFSVFSGVATVSPDENRWPPIRQYRKIFVFSDSRDAHIALTVHSMQGKELYDLQCHPGDYPDDPFFDYSGFFHCRLRSLYSKDKLDSLLADSFSDTKEWRNRGRFLPGHLLPQRESYLDWGRERRFHLRGMEIVLKVFDESFDKNHEGITKKISAFKFLVDISSDPSSGRAIAKLPENPRPEWFYRSYLPVPTGQHKMLDQMVERDSIDDSVDLVQEQYLPKKSR